MQRNLFEYLENSAARFPDKTAYADVGRAFTFGGLLDFSLRCGSAVARRTNAVNRPVIVMAARTAVTAAAFQAVLASGNFYVPVDAAMPVQRMRAILEQIRPALLLYTAGQEGIARELADNCPILDLSEAEREAPDRELLSRARAQVLDIDPAYAIFTSGSTGTPKGIVCHHRGVMDQTEWLAQAGPFSEDDVLGNQTPFFFDGSVKDVYITLKCGCTCHILPKKLFIFPKLLIEELNDKKVTTLAWATSAVHMVAASGVLDMYRPQFLNKVLAGGEALQAKELNIWRRALPQVQYVNLYGPTEVTVDCTFYPIRREFADSEPIPIGKACANMEVLLLEGDRPVPPGEPGEICVRGTGLALGYYGDWERTAQAFVQNPLNPDYPDRLYRTGDIGVMDENGDILFLSRKDGQIKHLGYRIELGEIETALHGTPRVREAVCLFHQERDKLVCCYEGEITPDELAGELRDRLPRYMTPNLYHRLEEMPRTPNGKLDRARLRREYLC